MASHTFNVLSLCSGVDGLGLAVKLAVPSARTICHVEGEAYCVEILVRRMQEGFLDECPIWSDVKTFRGSRWRGAVDCLIAGYPCQPFSVAGKQLAEADPRHLWPHVARIIGECEPSIIFLENVPGHVALGLPDVAADLRRMGFVVPRPLLLAASDVGAPQRRERIFIIAYKMGNSKGKRAQRAGLLRTGKSKRIRGSLRASTELPDDAGRQTSGIEERGPHDADAGSQTDVADALRDGEHGRERPRSGSGGGVCESGGADGGVVGDAERNSRKRRRVTFNFPETPSGTEGDGEQRERLRDATGNHGFTVWPGPCPDCGANQGEWHAAHCPGPHRCDRGSDGAMGIGIGIGSQGQLEAGPTARPVVGTDGDDGIYYWPPGPAARSEWERILAVRPDLAPAVESEIRGVVAGASKRVGSTRTDELRSLGNLVVPIQGAAAFLILVNRLKEVIHAT